MIKFLSRSDERGNAPSPVFGSSHVRFQDRAHFFHSGRGSLVGILPVNNFLLQADLISIPTSGTFFREDHEHISSAILPLPLIHKEQLSVNSERMYT